MKRNVLMPLLKIPCLSISVLQSRVGAQILLEKGGDHSEAEVLEVSEAKSPPLDELDLIVDSFDHAIGCASMEVVGNLLQPMG